MNTLLPQFLKYLATEKNRGAQTVANYDYYLSCFLNWAKINDPKKIDAKLLANYSIWLSRQTDRFGHPLAKTTENYHLIALRSFLKYLNEKNKNEISYRQVKLNRAESTTAPALGNDEVNELLDAPLHTKEEKDIRLRDKSLMEILFSSGLKVSPLSRLKKEDVDLDGGSILSGKFKLTNQGKYYLRQYLGTRRDGSPYLFVRQDRAKGNRPPVHLTPRSIQRIIKNYAAGCGLKNKVSPQVIRQTVIKNGLTRQ